MIDGGEGTASVEDELSLSCHLVLRRNWNGVRSTITLAFARDRVSDVCTCIHVRTYTHTYASVRARIIAGFFPTRTDSGNCDRSSRVWNRPRVYENETIWYLFRGEEQREVIVMPLFPLSRVARHSLVTSGLYSRKNIRGKAGEGRRWRKVELFDDRATSYASSGCWRCCIKYVINNYLACCKKPIKQFNYKLNQNIKKK